MFRSHEQKEIPLLRRSSYAEELSPQPTVFTYVCGRKNIYKAK